MMNPLRYSCFHETYHFHHADSPNKTILADFSKPDPKRLFERKDVKWVIGHRWKQRFIGEVNGKEVVFPAQKKS